MADTKKTKKTIRQAKGDKIKRKTPPVEIPGTDTSFRPVLSDKIKEQLEKKRKEKLQVRSDPEHKDSPELIFADLSGKPLTQIALAPGEAQTIRIVLNKHPELITRAFQAVWHINSPSGALSCAAVNGSNWIKPLALTTGDEDAGGMEGNISQSMIQADGWKWLCFNSKSNQFWYPRGKFMPPIAVAEFTIKVASNWTDQSATLELDTSQTNFVQTSDAAIPASSQYDAQPASPMVLTIINKNAMAGQGKKAAPLITYTHDSDKVIIKATGNGMVRLATSDEKQVETKQDTVSISKKYKSQSGLDLDVKACIWENGKAMSDYTTQHIHIPPVTQPLPAPQLAFGKNGKQLTDVTLSPGEETTLQLILVKHPEVITRAFQTYWNMVDSLNRPTDDVTIAALGGQTKDWLKPLNLSTGDASAGGIAGNTVISNSGSDKGQWIAVGQNLQANQFWYPKGKHMPPIVIAEFTIVPSKSWSDKYAIMRLDTSNAIFIQTSDKYPDTSSQYQAKYAGNLSLQITNKDYSDAKPTTPGHQEPHPGTAGSGGGDNGNNNSGGGDSGNDEGKGKLESLSFRNIIGGPLKACVEAQEQTSNATYDYLTRVMLEKDADGVADYKPVMMNFCFDKNGVTNRFEVPLMSILPIPYMSIERVNLDFEAMVTYCKKTQSSGNSKEQYLLKACYPAFADLRRRYQKVERERKDDNHDTLTARENISIRIQATTSDQPAGLSRLIEILDTHMTEFIQIESGKQTEKG